jgi:hypothetical protein
VVIHFFCRDIVCSPGEVWITCVDDSECAVAGSGCVSHFGFLSYLELRSASSCNARIASEWWTVARK